MSYGTERSECRITFDDNFVKVMARNKHPAKKKRLIKKSDQTKWAPFWTVFKIYGAGRRVHPSRHTEIKRTWRRGNTKV